MDKSLSINPNCPDEIKEDKSKTILVGLIALAAKGVFTPSDKVAVAIACVQSANAALLFFCVTVIFVIKVGFPSS